MISIIVSSYNQEYFNQFSKNISETIGIEYEIIQIWNPGVMGICEAYNSGAKKAIYPYLIFCHEDVKYHTNSWGDIIINHFKKLSNPGVLGVAGGTYIPTVPSGWYTNEANAMINIYQHERSGMKNMIKTFDSLTKEVKIVDGVFLAIKKDIFNLYKFANDNGGFHGYDTELCIRLLGKYKNYVLGDIILEHFSPGNPNIEWFKKNIEIRKKYNNIISDEIDYEAEYGAYSLFIEDNYKYNGISIKSLLISLHFFPYFKLKGLMNIRILKQLIKPLINA
ncbi:hypothetical protein I6H88_11170 [Elizabethkingia bruuniana]|uniref:Streptomycin biosynthesis protein StrF domain-containing protein n=1 Tax=Elizabethkingia bruuniana TaxID=1756149 RepID=A0A7T7UVL9_9FLAO|nr:glycosyltransferase [Elizabethkingia bruuniana]KGO10463.1 hypothetical protein KS04_09155 [Elizabethkingia miricola]AQX83623.1 hypothetical protein AYC65_00680 [Elizabethkingia bruuniana]KUY22262.1 hypothetical protein ATB97_13515 [Elizabethkingia bruuniana]OPB62473.1 hypothetical protein BAY12_11255 [Elizabethkingia bruuniana]QDZ63607.1 hypothetical protein EVD20_14835 [Elizabethkingia bruuniana]